MVNTGRATPSAGRDAPPDGDTIAVTPEAPLTQPTHTPAAFAAKWRGVTTPDALPTARSGGAASKYLHRQPSHQLAVRRAEAALRRRRRASGGRYRGASSTLRVLRCYDTRKSRLNRVAQDSGWETELAAKLEDMDEDAIGARAAPVRAPKRSSVSEPGRPCPRGRRPRR